VIDSKATSFGGGDEPGSDKQQVKLKSNRQAKNRSLLTLWITTLTSLASFPIIVAKSAWWSCVHCPPQNQGNDKIAYFPHGIFRAAKDQELLAPANFAGQLNIVSVTDGARST